MLLELSLLGTFGLRTRERNHKNDLWRKCGAWPRQLWARRSVTITHALTTGFSFQDKVLRMLYVWALCRDQDELNPYAAWRLLDISSSSTEQVLWEESHPRASLKRRRLWTCANLLYDGLWGKEARLVPFQKNGCSVCPHYTNPYNELDASDISALRFAV